nr:hypothetical protein DA06_07315 [Georgenia sp. SUBG003]
MCSSSRRICGSEKVAMSRDSAWRWPPERRPTLALSRSSRPSSRLASSSRKRPRLADVTPRASPRRRPRSSAMARFSSMVMCGAVPAIGSWNTRPM